MDYIDTWKIVSGEMGFLASKYSLLGCWRYFLKGHKLFLQACLKSTFPLGLFLSGWEVFIGNVGCSSTFPSPRKLKILVGISSFLLFSFCIISSVVHNDGFLSLTSRAVPFLCVLSLKCVLVRFEYWLGSWIFSITGIVSACILWLCCLSPFFSELDTRIKMWWVYCI